MSIEANFRAPRETAEVIPFRAPKPLGLPVMEGVTEGVSLGDVAVPAFSFAIFDLNVRVSEALEAAIRHSEGDGKVLRGVILDHRVAVSTSVKHPLYLANVLRDVDPSAQAPSDSTAVAFEVRQPSKSEPFEIRYSLGYRNGEFKKDRRKNAKKHKSDLARLKTFLKDNLPRKMLREGEKPLHVIV